MSIQSNFPDSRPTLNLDFANSQVVDPRITFTRASTATYTDKLGLLAYSSANSPRIDFDPITMACKGLLIEEQRTNLLLRSEEFDNAAWVGTVTRAANDVVAPDGTTTGDTITTTGASDSLYQLVTVTASTTYTFSVYVKLGTISVANYKIAIYNNTAASFIAADVVPTPEPNTSSWTRITYTFTTPVGCTSIRVYPFRNTIAIPSSTVSFWGAQLEAGEFPTSYIPTTTAQVTRAADVALMDGTNFSSWFNATEGTFVAQGSVPSVQLTNRYFINAGQSASSSQDIQIQISRSADSRRQATINANTTQFSYAPPGTAIAAKGALAYKLDDSQGAYDGTAGIVDTSVTLPSLLATLYIGNSDSGIGPLNGHIQRVSYYSTRLSETNLVALTT